MCKWSVCISVSLAVVSIAVAIFIQQTDDAEIKNYAYWLVGAWVLLPPIWFIWEWHQFPIASCPTKFEHFKYSQELARNVWLAMVGVLAAITGIKWGG